ncbi:hypothetical protein HELRODRAFT_177842 [Helobdella robusta]|uniref:Uncharacterized protein n=1 Tax=Helobdella robusta TaxID=6412 RepID=T1FCC8_HELRO|nr:hypothetical protein HELRODRAFT_177842 [Helobdella robusta]ESN97779.1 hypothetical protein HELRODRAFT_177842 [Helobdella robusta]
MHKKLKTKYLNGRIDGAMVKIPCTADDSTQEMILPYNSTKSDLCEFKVEMIQIRCDNLYIRCKSIRNMKNKASKSEKNVHYTHILKLTENFQIPTLNFTSGFMLVKSYTLALQFEEKTLVNGEIC